MKRFQMTSRFMTLNVTFNTLNITFLDFIPVHLYAYSVTMILTFTQR